ncbi:hypothetical protein HJC23_001151 [Cyclotella cryptica]|uniref:Uncharacterized protein n=1 Tax=Cyclotella cryptica TaxID=29204 RepID=A0ABD3P603_9STRA|eukprot:CCRYP_017379-RA/>CCRYP_017379-RA protein AED:0.12 eAED:0.12 QI:0/-1/0/1/-1/1/1/0/289
MMRKSTYGVAFCAFPWSFAALLISWNFAPFTQALQTPQLKPAVTRRSTIGYITGAASSALFLPLNNPATAQEESTTLKPSIQYENRDRKQNKEALIREDYWYFSGRKPPRRLDIDAFPADDPTWNAWGECTKSESTGNSCVYVSLKQRIPAHGKYAFSISLGASEYGQLGKILRSSNVNWAEAAKLVDAGVEQRMPSPAVDALLKMALFATQMLTSPNYSGPSRELLVSRFYINECAFAIKHLGKAIEERDVDTALALWEFGKDSWNSYLSIVNRSISPKVGDKLPMIS